MRYNNILKIYFASLHQILCQTYALILTTTKNKVIVITRVGYNSNITEPITSWLSSKSQISYKLWPILKFLNFI